MIISIKKQILHEARIIQITHYRLANLAVSIEQLITKKIPAFC